MSTYYAVCNVNGPISVRLNAGSEAAATEEFAAADSRAWVDGPRLDAEDDLGICGDGFDLTPYLDKGVFKELRDTGYFRRVRVVAGSIEWPNEQDLSHDTLYLRSIPTQSEQAA